MRKKNFICCILLSAALIALVCVDRQMPVLKKDPQKSIVFHAKKINPRPATQTCASACHPQVMAKPAIAPKAKNFTGIIRTSPQVVRNWFKTRDASSNG